MRCYECGRPLSNIWEAYVALSEYLLTKPNKSGGGKTKSNKLSKTKKLAKSERKIHKLMDVKLIPVFEALAIHRLCCRMHLVGARNIHNF
jgi:DNA-directed RNA polymerase subunit N (RpoN/RPB10)